MYRIPILKTKRIIFTPECIIPGMTVFMLKWALAPERTWRLGGRSSALLALCEGNPYKSLRSNLHFEVFVRWGTSRSAFQAANDPSAPLVPKKCANELSSVVWKSCLSPNWPIYWPTQKQCWRWLHDHLPHQVMTSWLANSLHNLPFWQGKSLVSEMWQSWKIWTRMHAFSNEIRSFERLRSFSPDDQLTYTTLP